MHNITQMPEVSQQITHAAATDEILSLLKPLPSSTLVFIDIDDTIITPQSITFRAAPYNQLVNEIKKNRGQYEHYEKIISSWRLQRKIMLLDPQWPSALEYLKTKFSVHALTLMDHGACGHIPSLEQWRYEELKSLGILFSQYHSINASKEASAAHHGIIMTGPLSKRATIEQHWPALKTDSIVLIDDREDHLLDVAAFCQQQNISFLGIHFKGLQKVAGQPDPILHDFQRQHLITHHRWLEDEEAYALINQQNKKTDC